VNTNKTVVVALDPSSLDGEAALDHTTSTEHITLFLPLTGSPFVALSEFAQSEGISVAEAGVIYLDQVASRLRADGAEVDGVTSTSADSVSAILHLIELGSVSKVVLPPGIISLEPAALRRLVSLGGVPVVIAPAA
jgi:hypothetical protein